MNSDIRPRIESTNAQFVSAFKRGDAAGIANLYTEGAQTTAA
jgi:ketosteroid isomerase-like protein